MGPMFALVVLADRPTAAKEPEVKVLMMKDVVGAAGKEAVMLTVEYPPGATEQAHRHDGQAFVYVLEGSVVMQVKGQAPVTLNPGDTFYEGKDDIHLVGRNASSSARARFVVVLLKAKGAAPVLPAQ
jgi:quercetin dioxygenase-like cupin family protein